VKVLVTGFLNIFRRYIDHLKFAAYMAFTFITFFRVILVPFFLSLYIWLYVLFAFVKFCKLCIFIVMFIYCYCYICSVLYILFTSFKLALFDYPD